MSRNSKLLFWSMNTVLNWREIFCQGKQNMTKEEQIKTELYECCVWQQETKITNFLPQKKGHYSYFDFKHNEDSEKED